MFRTAAYVKRGGFELYAFVLTRLALYFILQPIWDGLLGGPLREWAGEALCFEIENMVSFAAGYFGLVGIQVGKRVLLVEAWVALARGDNVLIKRLMCVGMLGFVVSLPQLRDGKVLCLI
jgi:hypothetical protein